MTTQRAAAYVRVSDEQPINGWSLDEQERRIREYARENNSVIVQVYRDEVAESKDKLPGFGQMMLDAHDGLFDTIIAVHPSVLFRNMALAYRYQVELRTKLDIEVIFLRQPVLALPSVTMEAMNDMFDEFMHYQLQVRTTLGKQARAQRGLYNGVLPFGYALNGEDIPVAHPTNAAGVIIAFNVYARGKHTDAQIAELLNDKGYRTSGNWGQRHFTKDTVNRILQNAFYLGVVKYKGKTFPGQHPALIEPEVFAECQDIRAMRARKPGTVRKQKRVYILAGIARCSECELTLRGGATQSKGEWRYYRHTAHDRGVECSVPGKMVRADALEEQWANLLSTIQLTDEWRQRFLLMGPDEEQPEVVEDLGKLWDAATMEERRAITQMLLQALYVDVLDGKITAIEPCPDAKALFTASATDLGMTVL
jgi:DNA invertase Pin-like site-specific DNA recombinase